MFFSSKQNFAESTKFGKAQKATKLLFWTWLPRSISLSVNLQVCPLPTHPFFVVQEITFLTASHISALQVLLSVGDKHKAPHAQFLLEMELFAAKLKRRNYDCSSFKNFH